MRTEAKKGKKKRPCSTGDNADDTFTNSGMHAFSAETGAKKA